MALANQELATINPNGDGTYTVIVHSDDGKQLADFDCDSERSAVALRNAIRQHAARLRHVADYRRSTR